MLTKRGGDRFREISDADIIIRMLYFCEEPKYPAQIMLHCQLDRVQFGRYSDHCIRRNLLKIMSPDYGVYSLVLTQRGRETLAAADSIMTALGILRGSESDEQLR